MSPPAESLGPLERYDPYSEKPEGVSRVLGNPRIGLTRAKGRRLCRLAEGDRWYIQLKNPVPSEVALIELDRNEGEVLTREIIRIQEPWVVTKDGKHLFGTRRKDAVTPVYECFDLGSNESLWTIEEGIRVCASEISWGGSELIVLEAVPERPGLQIPSYVSWYDLKTGQRKRRVPLPGHMSASDVAGSSAIGVSKDAVYVARQSEQYEKCFVIRPGDEKPGQVETGSVANDDPLVVTGGRNGELVAFYNDHELKLFRSGWNSLHEMHEIDSGASSQEGYRVDIVRFAPGGEYMVAGMHGTTLVVSTRNATSPLIRRIDYGTELGDFTNDGEYFVFFDDGGGWAYETKTWTRVRDGRYKNRSHHCCPIKELSFSADGTMMISGDTRRLFLWRTGEYRLLAELISPRLHGKDWFRMQSPVILHKHRKVYAADGFEYLEWDLDEVMRQVEAAGDEILQIEGKIAFGALASRTTKAQRMDVACDEEERHILTGTIWNVTYRHAEAPEASRLIMKSKYRMNPDREFVFQEDSPKAFLTCYGSDYVLDLEGKIAPVKLEGGVVGVAPAAGLLFDYRFGKEGKRRTGILGARPIGEPDPSVDTWTFPPEWNVLGEIGVTAIPDGRWLVLELNHIEGERYLVVLDWKEKRVVWKRKFPWHWTSLALSPDLKQLVVGSFNRSVYFFDFEAIRNSPAK